MTSPARRMHESFVLQESFLNKTNSQNMSTLDNDNLVNALKNRLLQSRTKLQSWVEEQKAVCETVTNRYRADRQTYQEQIDSKMQSILAWQMEKGMTISDSNNASDAVDNENHEVAALKESIDTLENKIASRKEHLDKLHKDKEAFEEESKTDTSVFENSVNPTQTTFDKLQSIVKGYQYLSGLSFEKAENERLRFYLTGLDKENRDRRFSFLLSTSSDDLYMVENCTPPIPEESLFGLVEELNRSEDLGRFVQGIRKVWATTSLTDSDGSDTNL